jgi:hypothetical protein
MDLSRKREILENTKELLSPARHREPARSGEAGGPVPPDQVGGHSSPQPPALRAYAPEGEHGEFLTGLTGLTGSF